MEALGFSFVGALASPDFFDGETVGLNFEQKRAIKEAADEKIIVLEDGGGDVVDIAGCAKWVLPVKLSGQGVEADDSRTGPADQHAFAGLFNNNGRRIRGRVVQCSPFFLSGDFIEGDDAGIFSAADLHYDQVVFHQRRGGNTPRGHFNFVLGIEVFTPEHASLCCVETEKVSHSAERVSAVTVDSDCSAWAVTMCESFVFAFVAVRPDTFAGHSIEAVDTLDLIWGS